MALNKSQFNNLGRWAMPTLQTKLKRFVTSTVLSAIHNLPEGEFPAVMQYD